MNIFNLIFKHKTMSETNDEEKSEQAIDEANVPDKADEVFRDKPENNPDAITEPTEDTGTIPEETVDEVETETDPDPKPIEDEEVEKEAEPLYQKKVFIVDLNNIGFKIEGEGELVVDVISIDSETQKAVIKNGDLTMEVPKEFLF